MIPSLWSVAKLAGFAFLIHAAIVLAIEKFKDGGPDDWA